MEVDVQLAPTLRLGEPRPLFIESKAQVNLAHGFAVYGDGSRFLVVRESVRHGEEPGGFVLVQNWAAEFAK